MAQISLYIDDSLAEMLGAAAESQNCSVSKFVAAIITQHLSDEDAEDERKMRVFCDLEGSINDCSFAEPPEIPLVAEKGRRYDLL